jgi:hypothetical protein
MALLQEVGIGDPVEGVAGLILGPGRSLSLSDPAVNTMRIR